MNYVFLSASEKFVEAVLCEREGKVLDSATVTTEDAVDPIVRVLSKGDVAVVVVPGLSSDVVMRRLYRQSGIAGDYPLSGRLLLDFVSMTWPLLHASFMQDRDLKAACTHFGVKYDERHEASCLRECFFLWMERVSVGQQVEDFGRTLIGGLGEGFMRLAGRFGRKEIGNGKEGTRSTRDPGAEGHEDGEARRPQGG